MLGSYLPLREMMDRLFEGNFIIPTGQQTFPPANLRVTDNDVIVEMAVPGVKAEDFTISVTGDTVTVTGETKRENHEQRGQTYVEEVIEGSFQRSFGLPVQVDADKAQASYENGMLTLTLPKAASVKPRTIPVTQPSMGQKQEPSSEGDMQQEAVPAATGSAS
jgi:HSP20 family protein